MIIDIIVILKCYLIFLFNRERGTPVGGIRIRYPCPNTDTLCFNTDTLYTLDKLYIIDESIIQITITLFLIIL